MRRAALAALLLFVSSAHVGRADDFWYTLHPKAWVIGDSISVASEQQYGAFDYNTDAEVGRQFSEGIKQARLLRPYLTGRVAVELGTNGPFSRAEVRQMMGVLSTQSRVVFVRNYIGPGPYNHIAQRAWVTSNNTVLDWTRRAWPQRVRLVPWDAYRLVGADGVHPTTQGERKLAVLIHAALTSR